MTTELGGVLTALATPFDADGRIDDTVLRALIDSSIDAGVDGLVAAGSTGEVGALSADERIRLVDVIVEHTAGRVPVVAQTGATSTTEAIRLSRRAQQSGADVLMLVTPYYEPLTLEETTDYLRTVAETAELPVMLYNIPDATGVNLDPDTVGALARDVESIRYLKDSSADMTQALQLLHHHRDQIGFFMGWDSLTFAALNEGAAGIVAGAANVVPRELVAVHRAIAAGDLAAARAEWDRLYPLIDALLSLPFMPAVKAAVTSLGLDVGAPRHPVAPLDPAQRDRIAQLAARIVPAAARP